MAFFFFRCCHGGHKGGNKMIIREDFDTKLRKALAIHYGLDKVFVEKIHPTGFDAYRIENKINDKFQLVHYLDKPYLMHYVLVLKI